jgi:hypothetical protein
MQKETLFTVFFLLVIVGSAAPPLAAQSPETGRFFRVGAGLGYSFAGYRDEIESPVNRYLNALTYIIDGNIEKFGFFHTFNINFFMGNSYMAAPHKEYIPRKYIYARGYIEYALDYRLWGNNTFPGYLGGAFRTVVYYSGVDTGESLTVPVGAGVFSLDLHFTQKWLINDKNLLVLSAGYPLLGYTVRPPYAGMDDLWAKYLYDGTYLKILTLGNITSFHNYWEVFGDLKYQHLVNHLFSVYSGLAFQLSRINFPHQRLDAIFRLNAGIVIIF